MDETDFEMIKKGFQYLGANQMAILKELQKIRELLEQQGEMDPRDIESLKRSIQGR